jgi:putative sigma-54 modulation protein
VAPIGEPKPDALRASLERRSAMNLHMTGHHLEITPSMRDYVASKMTRINRHFDHVIDVNMILTVEKLRQKIEANVHLSGKDIFVESADSDMYAAIDLLVDKLDRQIVKHKEKLQNRHMAEAPKRVLLA